MAHFALGLKVLCLFSLICVSVARPAEPDILRVMTFNVCVGGTYLGQPLEQTTRVIQAAGADIVGIQEGSAEERDGKHPDNARIIARQLGWIYFSQGDDDTSVMSRYKIIGQTPKKWGVQLELPSGRRIWVFNAHFAHAPYQPYQLLRIPYADAPFITTADEAVSEARKARGKQVAAMLAEIEAIRSRKTPVLITGDFNEPSSLDWTDAAHVARRCPLVVRWPTSVAILGAGFKDAYREAFPDPIRSPGFTWTPTTSADDPKDKHDRIDFVFVGGEGARVEKAEIVGEALGPADIVFTPYPSDHRAVVVTVKLE